MISKRFEGRLCIRPGCPARPATARLRRACGGAHSRPSVDPSDTALHPLAVVRRWSSQQISTDSFMVRNLTQIRRKFFHLNCAPRHIEIPNNSSAVQSNRAFVTATRHKNSEMISKR